MNKVAQILGQAAAQYSNKNYRAAWSLLQPLIEAGNKNQQVNHLAAIVLGYLGDFEQAKNIFEICLENNPKDSEVFNNYGNLLRRVGLTEQAAEKYRSSVDVNPSFVQGQLNLAICLFDLKSYSKSYSLAKKLDKAVANNAQIKRLLASCELELGDYQGARSRLLEILDEHPNSKRESLLLARVYGESHLDNDEFSLLKDLYQAYPLDEDVVIAYADITYRLGRHRDSVDILKHHLRQKPDSSRVHRLLNDVLWELGDESEFCQSYGSFSSIYLSDPTLLAAQTNQLLSAKRVEEAEAVLLKAELAKDHPILLSLQGLLALEKQNHQMAAARFESALQKEFIPETAVELVKHDLRGKRFDRAQSLVDRLLQFSPTNQLYWGLQATIWKAVDYERYLWLSRPNEFVKPYILETPKGFQNKEEFLRELVTVLEAKHELVRAPLTQSLVKGTQTPHKLLNSPEPVIQGLRSSIEEAIQSYVSFLPNEKDHPFLSRKSENFRFSGSWSVKLGDAGFHVSHVHPEGWISSASYINLPQNLGGEQQRGCIQFGVSPIDELNEKPDKVVEPQEGMLVLFPSYYWHGTIPFSAMGDYRMTVAFDVVTIE